MRCFQIAAAPTPVTAVSVSRSVLDLVGVGSRTALGQHPSDPLCDDGAVELTEPGLLGEHQVDPCHRHQVAVGLLEAHEQFIACARLCRNGPQDGAGGRGGDHVGDHAVVLDQMAQGAELEGALEPAAREHDRRPGSPRTGPLRCRRGLHDDILVGAGGSPTNRIGGPLR